MTQIFGIHCINGLPDIPSIKDNIPLIDNSSISLTNVVQFKSSIYIASDPAGAKIFIDDIEQTGFHTPAMMTDIPSGHHNVKLISPGYIDIESSIPLEPGKTYNVFLTMGRTNVSTSTGSPGIIILFAIGLGLLLIRNKT